jgi:hypothetical protein
MQQLTSVVEGMKEAITEAITSARSLLRHKGVGALGIALLGFVVKSLFDMAASDWWHSALLPWLPSDSQVPHWLIAGLVLMLLCVSALAVWLLADRQKLSERNASLQSRLRDRSSTVLERDARVQRAQNDLLNGMLRKTESIILALVWVVQEVWAGTSDVDTLTAKVLEATIHHIATMYGAQITRGAVLVLDPQDPCWLICYAAEGGIDPLNINRRHYIGPMDALAKISGYRRGLAGEAYLQRRPQLVHVDRLTREADSEYYVDYRGADGGFCLYESAVAIPIRLGPDDDNLLGVLCLDSPYRDTFDADPTCESAAHLLRVICYVLRMRTPETATQRTAAETMANA